MIREAKRFNVALTRARQGLIVIGNAPLLADADGNWATFLAFCYRHGLWEEEEHKKGEEGEEGRRGGKWRPKDDGGVPSYVSKLESAMVYAEDKVEEDGDGQGSVEGKMRGLRFSEMDDDMGMYASALAAEAALRED